MLGLNFIFYYFILTYETFTHCLLRQFIVSLTLTVTQLLFQRNASYHKFHINHISHVIQIFIIMFFKWYQLSYQFVIFFL